MLPHHHLGKCDWIYFMVNPHNLLFPYYEPLGSKIFCVLSFFVMTGEPTYAASKEGISIAHPSYINYHANFHKVCNFLWINNFHSFIYKPVLIIEGTKNQGNAKSTKIMFLKKNCVHMVSSEKWSFIVNYPCNTVTTVPCNPVWKIRMISVIKGIHHIKLMEATTRNYQIDT